MKKKRRVELHIEHREISLFAGPGGLIDQHTLSTRPDVSGLQCTRPEVCPNCGSFEMFLLKEVVASPGIDLSAIQRGMECGTLHIHRSADGAWWVCTQSLQRAD
jgi:hypothetical protein